MQGALIFVGSTGLAKLLPLLFGLLLTSLVGSHSYVHFVEILAQANFLTALATVSYTQMILASNTPEDSHNPQHLAVSALVFAAIVSALGGLWAGHAVPDAIPCNGNWACRAPAQTGLWVALYSFGNSVLMVQMSLLNAKLKGVRAGILLLCGLSLPYAVGALGLALNADDKVLLSAIAATLPIVALTAYWSANHTYLRALRLSSVRTLVALSLPRTREHGYIMLFSALILYAHAHALTAVNTANDHAAAAAFSLGYQLFAVGLFVPGVLGNLVVPLLGRRGQHSTKGVGPISAAYLVISLTSLSLVQIFGAHILSWYGLEPSKVSQGTLLTLQVAVVFASLNALVNQQLAARRRYGAMAGLSIVYLVTLLLAGYFNGHGAASVANAIVASYLVTLMMGMAIVRQSQTATTNPSAAHESDAAYWSARARKYGHTGWTNQAIYHYDQMLRLKLVKNTVEQLELPANAKCLDYGCGTGDFTRMISAMGLNVLGYDPSSAVIDVAHGQGVPRNARFTTRIEDLTAHGPYQLTLAVTVFQHILDDASLHSAIERVVQCMDNGGHLVLIESCTQATPQSAHVRGRTAEAWHDAFTSSGLHHCFTKSLYHPTLQPTPSFRAYSARPLVRALRIATHFKLPLATRWLRKIASTAAEADQDFFVEGNSAVILMVWRK